MNVHDALEFADNHHLGVALVAKGGDCLKDVLDPRSEPYLYFAFDSGSHVAAAWYAPGQPGAESPGDKPTTVLQDKGAINTIGVITYPKIYAGVRFRDDAGERSSFSSPATPSRLHSRTRWPI